MKQQLITHYFKISSYSKIRGYDYKLNTWRCLYCGKDMGEENPRQLCGKTRCLNISVH